MRIVLVETAGALNLGAVARVMQNFGLSDLCLVNPQCSPTDPQARQMAVHAHAILEQSQVFPTLAEAIGTCDRVIGTAGRIDRGDRPLLSTVAGCRWLLKAGTHRAIVFGREDRGLSNQELQYFPEVMTIPTVPTAPSLNLAQAVGICCYQLQLMQMEEMLVERSEALASVMEIESTCQAWERLLLEIGFLYPHTAFRRMAKIRRIFQKQALSPEEIQILRGILRQIRWAIAKANPVP